MFRTKDSFTPVSQQNVPHSDEDILKSEGQIASITTTLNQSLLSIADCRTRCFYRLILLQASIRIHLQKLALLGLVI
jgi:hypothetical protein